MSSIQVGEQVYDIVEAISGASLRDLKYLGRETSSKDYPKVTVKSMQDMFNRMGELLDAEGAEPVDLLSDDGFLANIIGVVWLARRKAGERELTYDEAGDIGFGDISFPDDEEDDAPKDEAAEPADPQ
jgi:hypothetical protein